ncbi:MAG: DUF58 domain-containing protein [Planctomycetota bacterium]
MNRSQKYFDPETLAAIQPLSLRARTLVEGLVAGMHRSPQRGSSAEFAQHREYVPGDDIRQVDWKVFARSDRYYLKQYEDETNLSCYFFVDQSESMDFRGSQSPLSKLEYVQLVSCALAYLITSQQDQAGLVTYSKSIDAWLPASSSISQFDDFVHLFDQGAITREGSARTKITRTTDLPAAVHDFVTRLKKPALVVICSDMLGELVDSQRALSLLAHAGHDVVLLHTLDNDEMHFPFDQATQFEGLEGLPDLTTDPRPIAMAYRRAMQQFQQDLQVICRQQNADYFLLNTADSLARELPRILANRRRSTRN